ncbi:type IV pilus modification PilV family protein [Pleionea sediminis]|uniref:type IV pilus modification PilV family protein n=1 Tax=Pleionea sediminis TaxID=2569479 RepID=UPI001FEAC913|nr:type II secretion system protein [Pleionea sediminis]
MRGFVNSGFTLIEIVIAIVVFAVALTVLVVAFNPSTSATSDPVLQARAAELGQAYLEEIRGKRFDENNGIGSQIRCGDGVAPACSTTLGPESESRENYDDVDDYNGLTESPTDALGNQKTNYSASYSVSITVSYAGTELGLSNQNAKRIDVTVNAPNNAIYFFSTYRTNF